MKPAPPVMRSRWGVVGGMGEDGDKGPLSPTALKGGESTGCGKVGVLGCWGVGGDDRLEAYPTGIRSEFLANPATRGACLRGGLGGEVVCLAYAAGYDKCWQEAGVLADAAGYGKLEAKR